jgi:cyclohexanone monooxygenase
MVGQEQSNDDGGGSAPDFDVLIIGAGVGGLGMLYQALESGLSAHAFEAGGDVGGTWYWNRYPGARCDSPSEVYRYFFSPELHESWTWSKKYADQPEILRYLQHVADRFDLRRHITFDSRVQAASFDEESCRWVLQVGDQGLEVTCRYLVSAVGCLSAYQMPNFEGLSSFEGEWHHTARWPADGVDFRGKRVAVIGTGSTGIQCIPIIARECEQLTVFQRTPNFSLPARDHVLSDEERAEIARSIDDIHKEIRHTYSGQRYDLMPGSALEVPADVRERFYEEGWERGGFALLFNGWEDLLTNAEANETAAAFVRAKIGAIVKDPVKRELLVPHDHPIGTKRPALDSGYFETFNRANVDLVDVRAAPILEITPTGIRTASESYEFDVIVFATGFDAITGALLAMDVRGRDGVSLRDKWRDGPVTYLGLATAGFPNLFMMTGPGSPNVLGNMTTGLEQHFEWIRDCLAYLQSAGHQRVEARPEAEAEWTERVESIAATTLMVGVDSWYMGANIPGKPRRFLSYLGGIGEYGDALVTESTSGYPGFELS